MSADRPGTEGGPPQELGAFLRRLAEQVPPPAGADPLPQPPGPELRELTAADDVVARFAAAAEAEGCRVHRTGPDGWADIVLAVLREHGAARVAVEPLAGSALDAGRAAALSAALAAAGLGAPPDRSGAALFEVDAAVTGVRAAVAETGTLVCASGPQTARGSSLIPPLHVAVVAAAQVVPDLFDLFDALGRGTELPANVNLITGPSKTADIEGVLVTGVHGPGAVHIVLLEGA